MYDAAIIGTGAAGISAALTLQSRNKSVLLLGKTNLSKKMEAAEQIRNYPGLGIVSGSKMLECFTNHLMEMNIGITDKHVTEISKVGDHFQILCGVETWEAYAVILAMGVSNTSVYPNEERLLGKGVSYCATCDGFLYGGKPIAVICHSEEFEPEVDYLSQITSQVYLAVKYKTDHIFEKNVTMISDDHLEICGDSHVEAIAADGDQIPVNAVFIMRESVAPGVMLKGLGVDGNHIAVQRDCSTNIKGCYAAGDCTGRPYQYVKAAGEGNVAAHSVLAYLAENGFAGNAQTRPYKTRPLSFMDAVDITDISGLPTEEEIDGMVQYNLTKSEVTLIRKNIAEKGDVICFRTKGGEGRFDREFLRLTLGQNLYDYEVEKGILGRKTGENFTVVKDGKPIAITVLEIYKPVSVEPTDEMAKAEDPEVSSLSEYREKIRKEAIENELNRIAGNVFNELFAQEPDPDTPEEIIRRLGELELGFFDELFKKERKTGLFDMSPVQLKESLGAATTDEFLEMRKSWYKMKHKQLLVLSKHLNIPLEGEYDFMSHYEALGLLMKEGVEKVKSAVLGKAGIQI